MATKKIEEIKTHPAFESLFPINDRLLHEIEKDMSDGNYDFSQPIILATWQGQKEEICIDGHTRLQAGKNVGIEEVPVFVHEFDTEDEALEKAIKLQRNRRNMTDGEILTCVEALDKRKPRGGDRRSEEAKSKASDDAIEKPAKSAEETANLLGISTTKVERNRSVLKNGDSETIEAVKSGEMSMNQAYQKTRDKKKKAKFEKADKGSKQHENKEEPKIMNQTSSNGRQPVLIPIEQFWALTGLGGSVDEHVSTAIDFYLESKLATYSGFPAEMEQNLDNEAPEDDDEEYYYPENYEKS